MGRLSFLIIILLFLNACSKDAGDFFIQKPAGNTTVYICNGHYSKSYHFNSQCEGLRSCTTDIYETSIESAEKKERTLCGYEQN